MKYERFENEVITCIRQYNPHVDIVVNTDFPTLASTSVHVAGKNLIFHLLPIPFSGLENISPTYFQEKSLEYAARSIQLVHVWQDCWMLHRDIVYSRIAALSGSSVPIHARQTTIQRIKKEATRSFFALNHLQGPVNARYHYGLYYGGQLVAACSFSAGRTVTRNGVTGRSFELLRYANMLHHLVIGGIGKLTARFIQEVAPDDVMTYADLDWGTGKGYQTLNFVRTMTTVTQSFWIHPHKMIRYYPHRLPPQLTEAFAQQNRFGNINDFLTDKGFFRIYNAGNLKYILNILNHYSW